MGRMLSRLSLRKLRRLTFGLGSHGRLQNTKWSRALLLHCRCLASTSSSPPKLTALQIRKNLGVAEAAKSVGIYSVSESPFEVW